MNTLENNKLIAEFMEYPSNGFSKYVCPVKDIPVEADELPYHTSWDWLMPVVEKIESLGYNVHIRDVDCVIYNWTDKSTDELLHIESGNGKLQSTYQAVVEFIKWYNENK